MDKALRLLFFVFLISITVWLGNHLLRDKLTDHYINISSISSGMTRGSEIKMRIMEHFNMYNELPNSNEILGLPEPTQFNIDGVDTITIKEGGVIHFTFSTDAEEKSGHIFLIPNFLDDSFASQWRCITPSYRAIREWMPQCKYLPLNSPTLQ